MRLLIDSKPGWRLFKDKSIIGIPRYILEDTKTHNTIVMNGLWFNKKKALQILKDIK